MDNYRGAMGLNSATSEYNQLDFIVRQIVSPLATATLAQIVAVYPARQAVDIHPMVAQIDGRGQPTPHGVVHNVPYLTLQGGGNAVLIEPAVGDIGIAVFASRDISSVKATRKSSNPGTRRRFDMADALYIGGVLNAAPTQYVKLAADGITLHSATAVKLDAPSVTIIAPTVSITGALVVSGTVTAHGFITV